MRGKIVPPQMYLILVVAMLLICCSILLVNILPHLVNYINIQFNSSDKDTVIRDFSIAHGVLSFLACSSLCCGTITLVFGVKALF